MKRISMALAVACLAYSGSARADWGGYGTPAPGASNVPTGVQSEFNSPGTLTGFAHAQANKSPDRYGLLPGLRKAFHLDKSSCSTCGDSKGGPLGLGLLNKGGTCHGCKGGYDAYPQYPPVMQGTLVFPNHTFVRSPRDYFMYEPGR
jgi:hypothetical protein